MNIADVASQVGTVYDRTLHTSLTLPYSGFENIAIAQNDVVTSAVINNAIDKLYSNYIQLYRYSNVASNVIPISSIAFAGALPSNPPAYSISTGTQFLTSYITTPVYTVEPSTQTDTFTVTSYKTTTQNITSYTLSSNIIYYENLLLYSNTLNANSWSGTVSVIPTNTPSPHNNKSVVWKLVESKKSTLQFLSQAPTNTIYPGFTYTFSIYAKASDRNFLAIWFQDSDYSIFNLTNGSVTNVKNNTAVSLHNNHSSTSYVGNGWYICTLSLVVNQPITGSCRVGFGPAGSSSNIPIYKGDGKSGVYVWGAQLVYGAQTYPYVETHSLPIGTVLPPTSNITSTPTTKKFTKKFTSSTIWSVPAGVTSINVIAVGGGGGGGSGYEVGDGAGGGGGGSGYKATGNYAVTPGQRLSINIGKGGSGAAPVGVRGAFANGGDGTSSSISQLGITARGGSGGKAPLNYGGWGSGGTFGDFKNWGSIGGAGGAGGNNGGNGQAGAFDGASGYGGKGGASVYGGYGTGGDGAYFINLGGWFFNGNPGSDGGIVISYTQATNTTTTSYIPNIQSLATTVTSQIVNVTKESSLVPVFQTNTNTYITYLSSVQYITTAQITPTSFDIYTPVTTLKWYTTSNFLSTSQFLPLSTTQYPNLDNIQTITGGINTAITPNNYVIFASTGTDLIALTGDTNLQNISVALSTNTTALFSNVYFIGINKLLLDSNTNYLYAVDLSANLIHQFDASGFLTNNNILANKLIYIKSIGGYGGYDDAHLFNNPQSIIINNSNLYILDSGNSCIKQYDTDLNWITTHRLFRDFYNNYPIDMSVDGNGNIYVLTNTNTLLQYSNNFNTKTVINLPALYNVGEYYQNIVTSITYNDIFYLVTNMNVYKKFYSAINDTIGNYLFYRFNVTPGENIITFASLINATGSDTNVIFSTYNGAGKFGLYADNINLDTVLVTNNFDIYPLSAIQINNDEYVQNWVFNKAIAKLIINHTRLRNLIFSRFLYEPDDHGTLTFQGTRYLTSDETLSVTFDQDMQNFIGCNEIFQNIIVNRSLRAVYDAQVAIFNMLQLDIQTAPDLNIPVYIN